MYTVWALGIALMLRYVLVAGWTGQKLSTADLCVLKSTFKYAGKDSGSMHLTDVLVHQIVFGSWSQLDSLSVGLVADRQPTFC